MRTVEQSLEHLQRTFTGVSIPLNVRVSEALSCLPLLRRFRKAALGCRGIPAKGTFVYRRGRSEHLVRFNGRNLQFHALYEPAYRRGYELESAVVMMILCQGRGAFLDVGSNWGYFALLMASLPDFQGSVVAFEPNPRTYGDLVDVVRQAGLGDRITPMNIGIGAEDCRMTVDEPDRLRSGLSRLVPAGGGTGIVVKRLDALEVPEPRLVKIDAEGMESAVLNGMAAMLGTRRPFVLIENFAEPMDPGQTLGPFEILASHGYRVFVPALVFQCGGYEVPATYGSDFPGLLEGDARPRLRLYEVTASHRFLCKDQLNLLAVPKSGMDELLAGGVVEIDEGK